MPAWLVSAVVVGLLLCSTMVDAHAFLSYPAPRGQFANPPKRVDEEEAPTGTSPNDQAFVCRNDPEMPRANWASLTAGQSQPITITYDAPHIGDCFVYLTYDGDKAFSDMKWFKIWERHECHNSTNFDIAIPSYLPTGSHVIFRWEWYALHQYPNFIEYYAQCVDATVAGSASGQLPQPQVNMPGHLPSAVSAYWDPYAYPEEPMIFTGPAVATLNGAPITTGSNTQAPTSTPKPTSTPTTNPTTKPTSTPTTTPTSTPTSKPTSAPTAPPTSAPTNPPTSGGSASNIKVGLNSGTSNWWIGVVVSGGGETTVKVEMMDSGSFSNWVTLTDQSYAFVYEAPSVITLPISLRLTSSSGKQAFLPNVITSFYLAGLVDSGLSYSSSGTSAPTTTPTTKPTSTPTSTPTTKPTSTPTSTPTTKPTSTPTSVPTNKPTSVPTSAPTTAPTTKPTTGNPKVNIYADSNEWWLAVQISGTTESIAKIELKDAGTRTSYQAFTNAGWAYTFPTQGVALVTPLTVKVTTASGKVTYTTMSNITPGASLETASQ